MILQQPAIVAPAPANEETLSLTLDQAVALALRQNPDLSVAAARIHVARGQIAEARAELKPRLTVNGSATALDRKQGATFALPGSAPISFTTATRDQSQMLVSADMPIDISGRIRSNIRYAQVGREAAEWQSSAERNRVSVAVRENYFTVLQAQELVKVAEEAVTNAEERERTADSYVRAGTATRFETLRAATATADARQSLLVARNRVTLALAALANTLGVPQSNRIVVTVPEIATPDLPQFDEAASEAERQRPELLAAAAQVRSSEIAVRLATAGNDPTLGVGAQYQHSPRPGFGQASDLASVSLRLTIPIYDRGISGARKDQAKAQVEAAKNAYTSVRNNVTLEVRQEWLSRQEAEERHRVAAVALTQAEEQYRLAQNRYKAGINLKSDLSSPLLEISDAQTALTQARTNAINARFDVLKTQSRFEGALGRFAQPEVKP